MQLREYKGWLISESGVCYSKKLKRKLKPQLIGISGKKYYALGYIEGGKSKHIKVHIIVASLFIPNPENKSFINHKDGNKLNNDKNNLEWSTSKENVDHCYSTGLRDSKKFTGISSIKKINISELRSKRSTGVSQISLSKMYNVTQSAISRLLNF